MRFLFNNACIKSIECSTVATNFSITDDNELTVNWNISIGWYNPSLVNFYCSNKSIDIVLTELDCNAELCDERIIGVSIKNKSYTFLRKLTACAKYNYSIVDKPSGDAETLIKNSSLEAKEQFQKIDFEVYQRQDQVESIYISWPYENFPLCPKKFRIEVREEKSLIKVFETNKNINETIEEVQPCSKYEISVFSISSDKVVQRELGDTKSFNTITAIPDGIKNLKVEYNQESIDASWEAPSYAKCVKNYKIEVESSVDNRSDTTNRTNTVFVNVFACIIYTVRVIPVLLFDEIIAIPVEREIRVPSRGLLINFET